MAEVDVFLKEEWPALGDSEALEKQLEQCTVSITCLLDNYFFFTCLAYIEFTQMITIPKNKFIL